MFDVRFHLYQIETFSIPLKYGRLPTTPVEPPRTIAPLKGGESKVNGLMAWFTANWGMIMGVLGGAGGIAGFIKSFHIVREYELAVITKPRGNVVRDKETGKIKEYRGVVIRLAGLYRVVVVNMKDHVDLILLDGVMRPTENGHREKWQLSATVKWHIEKGYVYQASEWHLTDIGEYARGKIQNAILNYLENTPAAVELNSAGIFAASRTAAVQEELLTHGVVWTELMINKNALADSEIQGQAIREIGNAIPLNPSTD